MGDTKHDSYIKFLQSFILPEGKYYGFLTECEVEEFHKMCNGIPAIYETDIEEREVGWYRKNVNHCSLERAVRIANEILGLINLDKIAKDKKWENYSIPMLEDVANT